VQTLDGNAAQSANLTDQDPGFARKIVAVGEFHFFHVLRGRSAGNVVTGRFAALILLLILLLLRRQMTDHRILGGKCGCKRCEWMDNEWIMNEKLNDVNEWLASDNDLTNGL